LKLAENNQKRCQLRVCSAAGTLDEAAERGKVADRAIAVSNGFNAVQIALKVAAFALSGGSMAVLATLLDSFLSAVAGTVVTIATAAVNARGADDVVQYPVGKGRMEPVGIVILSAMVCTATTVVVLDNIKSLYTLAVSAAARRAVAENCVPLGLGAISLLVAAGCLKWGLRFVCQRAAEVSESSIVSTLAMDHRNDSLGTIFTLSVAIAAGMNPGAWFLDGLGSIMLCSFILYSYIMECCHTMGYLNAAGASKEFLATLRTVAENHHPDAQIDCCRAYHFGQKYLVEIECIVHEETTVKVAHAIALSLQHKVEDFAEVERCFVHLDHVVDGVFYGVDSDGGLTERVAAMETGVRDEVERRRSGDVPTKEQGSSLGETNQAEAAA